jgi:hypothetical protein
MAVTKTLAYFDTATITAQDLGLYKQRFIFTVDEWAQ